jgi:tetratricopeptide (TPR) repeat protein
MGAKRGRIINVMLSADLEWAREQTRWRSYHLQSLAARLAWAENYIDRRLHDPSGLADHCASLLTLLNQAREIRHLRNQVINLLLALDPWPVRWGHGPAWEALLCFGVEATDTPDELQRHAILLNALANSYLSSGQITLARDTAQRALEAALHKGMMEPVVNALDLVVFAALRQGEIVAAQAVLARVAGVVDEADWAKLPDMARLCFSYARILRRMGQLEEALAWADRAVRLLEGSAPVPLGDRSAGLLADAYNVRGVMCWAAVRYAEAAHDLEQAISLYRAAGDHRAETRVRGTLGLVYWSLGELGRAAALFLDAAGQSEEQDDRWQVAMNVGNLGLVELCRGKLRPAQVYFERQLILAEESGDMHEAMRALGNRGVVRLHRQDFTAALADLKVEQEFAARSGLPEGLICNYVTQVRCLAGLGSAADARALAVRALALARQTGSPALIIIALRCVAEQLQRVEQKASLAEALHLAQCTGRRLDEAACHITLAGLAPAGSTEQTAGWQRGVRLLRQIGAEAWLRGHSSQNPPQIVLIA